MFARAGARSGPQLDYGFPGVNCISVNDEAVHWIPSRRRLRNGDLVKLDVTAELDGFYADTCLSVPVGDMTPSARRLAATSRAALNRALATAHAGVPINHLGRVIEATFTKHGYSVCRDLMGHSIGRWIHEAPHVPNYNAPGSVPLTEGLVITIEPIIAAGDGAVRKTGDGWTIKTQTAATALTPSTRSSSLREPRWSSPPEGGERRGRWLGQASETSALLWRVPADCESRCRRCWLSLRQAAHRVSRHRRSMAVRCPTLGEHGRAIAGCLPRVCRCSARRDGTSRIRVKVGGARALLERRASG